MKKYNDQRKAKSQQGGAEQKLARGNEEQNHQEHQVNRKQGHIRNSKDKDNLEAKLEEAFLHLRLRHHNIDCVSEPGKSRSEVWRRGPSVTSEDVAKFFMAGSVGPVYFLGSGCCEHEHLY